MPGLGTLINIAGILLGGFCGLLFGRFLKESHRQTLSRVCGVCVLFIGIGGALEGLLSVENGQLISGNSMLMVLCLSLGALIGELLRIEDGFERFGVWLKQKTGNAKDKQFVEGFVTASLTVCIGAMAIVGALQDGLEGNYATLATKAILDLVIIMVMTCSLGKGCIFSALPVAVLQGGVTGLSFLIRPLMTPQALDNLSLIGSVLIFCVGINLIWDRRIKTANLLPAIVLAVAAAFLPV